MELNEYLKQSEVTEKKFPEGISLNTKQQATLMYVLGNLKYFGEIADAFKRHLIYGADLALPENVESQIQQVIEAKDLSDINHLNSFEAEVLHMILGINTEASEFAIAYGDMLFGGKVLNTLNLKEETGDLMFYQAGLLRLIDSDFETEAQRNIDKLKARYGDKFSEYAALNRDLDKEKEALEGN